MPVQIPDSITLVCLCCASSAGNNATRLRIKQSWYVERRRPKPAKPHAAQVRLALEVVFEGAQGSSSPDLGCVSGSPDGNILRVCDVITLTHTPAPSGSSAPAKLLLDWEAGTLADTVADAVVAVIMQVPTRRLMLGCAILFCMILAGEHPQMTVTAVPEPWRVKAHDGRQCTINLLLSCIGLRNLGNNVACLPAASVCVVLHRQKPVALRLDTGQGTPFFCPQLP